MLKKKSIKAIIDKGTGVTGRGFGALPRKYLFQITNLVSGTTKKNFILETKVTKF